MELCKCSMAEYLDSRFQKIGMTKGYAKPSTFELSKIVLEILGAISFLHENQVAHRDIKPENLLLSANGTWKLADFNLARSFRHGDSGSRKNPRKADKKFFTSGGLTQAKTHKKL